MYDLSSCRNVVRHHAAQQAVAAGTAAEADPLCGLQLTMLLQEYFEVKGSLHDTTCEHDLKDFLSRRAAKCALLRGT